MRPVRRTSVLFVAALVGVGLLGGIGIRVLSVRIGGTAPRVSWVAATTLAVVAVVVGVLAWKTWQSLHRKRLRMTSDHAIRMLALAKACIIVGAVFAGGYGGFALASAGGLDTPLGEERVVHGGVAAAAALGLLAAGLLLERACRLPEDDDEDERRGGKDAPDASPA